MERGKSNSRVALRRKRRKRRKKIIFIIALCSFILITGGALTLKLLKQSEDKGINVAAEKKEEVKENIVEGTTPAPEPLVEKKEIVISAAGDCILGTDDKFGYDMSFPAMLTNQNNDYGYFLSNVKNIFEEDDYTIVNLENPLTDEQVKADKGEGTVFHFKGPSEYTKILTSSSVEGVTIANNHIYDYGIEGYKDTVESLKNANLDFCGEGNVILTEVKGIKIGFLGYTGWSNDNALKEKIRADINNLRDQGAKIVIPYFHWGIERENIPYSVQTDLAHYAIDNGADLVLGSHPHVIQSIENYKDKLIVYSFGNFSFGGNFNPEDKRTFILQVKFNFLDNEMEDYAVKIISTSISSVDYRNDYKPTPMEGEAKTQFLKTINELSPTLNNKISDEFFLLKP